MTLDKALKAAQRTANYQHRDAFVWNAASPRDVEEGPKAGFHARTDPPAGVDCYTVVPS